MREQLATHLRLTLAAVALLALSGCGSLDLITARNAMGDKDRFQWDSPRAVRYEAIRLGTIKEGERLDGEAWNATLQKLVEEWFPVGTPVEQFIPYFERKGFNSKITMYGDYGYSRLLISSPDMAYQYFRLSYPVGIFGKNVVVVALVFHTSDEEREIVNVHSSVSGTFGI